MSRISRPLRSWLAFLIWGAGLLLFLGLGWWSVYSARKDAENRLISEAGRTAAQIAVLVAHPLAAGDSSGIRAMIRAAMEDERIYAVRVDAKDGLVEGERRNHLWEPVAWDDEIAEKCVQGMNPIRIGGRPEGHISVWLSPRLSEEEDALLVRRETSRFLIVGAIWTLVLALLLWLWGDLRRLARSWAKDDSHDPAAPVLGLAPGKGEEPAKDAGERFVDPRGGRDFQRRHPDSWLVTAGMFRQTFARAPALIGRLYAEGEFAGLCHLGRMLEQAAPCIGAAPLAQASRQMQNALNNPDCNIRALPVEKCAHILEQTLEALGAGKGPGRENGA